ncbi:LysM peptidoglycan-binding domain-containing protein [Bifidobacterium callimiconis]|nr:LysM peptidoglycan-binding domain-containing protein [Bifidobacterium callimiconis]
MVVWGRRAIGLLMVVLVILTFAAMGGRGDTRSESKSTEVVSYTVAPGDTLWSYASRITPEGDDVSETVEELKQLNHLQTSSLQVGQRIMVPVR